MFSPTSPVKKRAAWLRYGIAALCVAAGCLARAALTNAVGPQALPFIFFFPAIAVAAWAGGLGPAIFSVLIAALAAKWFFIEPTHTLRIASVFDAAAMLAFVGASSVIVAAIEAMRRARAQALDEIARREQAQAALAHERELLRVTLASIGDGVIATDALGCVTFLNPETERLSGWSLAEAAGRPLAEVFRIVNEKTRRDVENPVERVLRTGKLVGLANHTVLVSKSGVHTPIDDSAAPIRNPDGSVAGVVLVFRDVTEQRRAEEAQARLAAIVEHSGDVILTKNVAGSVETWNASAERLFGYTEKEIVGQPVTLLFPPERFHEEDHILDRLRQGEPAELLETIGVAKSGRRIPVAVSVSPLRNAEGEIIGASKIIRDISELVAAREALVREKELLATTLVSIGDGVIVTDADGRITFLNAEAERLTKWKSAEAAGHLLSDVFRIINEQTRAPVEDPVKKVLRLGSVVRLANHTLLIARDGSETPIDDSAAPIRQLGGSMFGVVLVFRDFTERRAAEEALRKNEALLTAVLKQLPLGLGVMDTDGRWIASNAFMDAVAPRAIPSSLLERRTRWRAYDGTGKMIAPEYWPGKRALRGEIVAPGLEMIFTDDNGRDRWMRVSAAPLRDDSGAIFGATCIVEDIDHVKHVQENVAEQAQVLELINDGIHTLDEELNITSWNNGAKRIFGFEENEVLGRKSFEVFRASVTPEQRAEYVRRVLGGEILRIEVEQRRKDGSVIWVDNTALVQRDTEGKFARFVSINRDITARRKAEAALRESEARFAGVIQSAMDAVIAVDAEQRIVLFNSAAEHMFGCAIADAVGSSLDRFIPAQSREAHRKHVETFGTTGATNRRMGALGALSGLRANGEEFPIEASISHLEVGGKKLFTVILRDVTERKRAEEALRSARDELVRVNASLDKAVQERTARLEEMIRELQHVSYAIAHDMRAPLRAMGAFAEILVEDAATHGTTAVAQDYCRRIVTAAGRLDILIRDALNYSRTVLEQPPLEPIDLAKLVRGLLDTYPNFHADKADITIDGDLPIVFGNDSLLTQCFSNLLGNAVKFVAPGIRPHVRVRVSELEPGVTRVWIEDNGIGIPEHAQPRLFGMFQKLDNRYEGTGIGLAIVRKVVERMGGKVGVESRPDHGSRFWVDLRRVSVDRVN